MIERNNGTMLRNMLYWITAIHVYLLPLIQFPRTNMSIFANALPPTYKPSHKPHYPTSQPSDCPSAYPTSKPTATPTNTMSPTFKPTVQPSSGPSSHPTRQPSRQPSVQPSRQPTRQPTSRPSRPSGQPSRQPSRQPTRQPSSKPSKYLSPKPSTTFSPTTEIPTQYPTYSLQPTREPTTFRPSPIPTIIPTRKPSNKPTIKPSKPSRQPTSYPTARPTSSKPTRGPTRKPTVISRKPSGQPSSEPTGRPSKQPTEHPTRQPTIQPTREPSRVAIHPTEEPTSFQPTCQPTNEPSVQPTSRPSLQPSVRPTQEPTMTMQPTTEPTTQPSHHPTRKPSCQPSSRPSRQATNAPSFPTGQPSRQPSRQPSSQPTRQPSSQPTRQPTRQPTCQPTMAPSNPTGQPTCRPSMQPSIQPTWSPVISYCPSGQPTQEPSSLPSTIPTCEPTREPSKIQPSSLPTSIPTSEPTSRPSIFAATLQPTTELSDTFDPGYVQMFPLNAGYCTPVEIRFSLTFSRNIIVGEYILIGTPGMTTGLCNVPSRGDNIPVLIMSNTSQFVGRYYEGDYANNFATSRIRFTIMQTVYKNVPYLIRIDRINSIKRTCVTNSSFVLSLGHNAVAGLDGALPTIWYYGGTIEFQDNKWEQCFAYYTGLTFYPAYPQQRMTINFTFMLPFTLKRGDYMVIHLPGFTNNKANYPLNSLKNTTGVLGTGKNVNGLNVTDIGQFSESYRNASSQERPVILKYSTQYHWYGNWHEGFKGNTSDKHAFNNSYLTLYPRGDESNSRMIWISLGGFENHLISELGRSTNFSGFTIEIHTAKFTLNKTAIMYTQAIGSGCNDFNGCYGNGKCNYEFARCECFDGYGSTSDRIAAGTDSFARDCSSMACPLGYASVAMVQDPTLPGLNYHRRVECSNNGMCDRSQGICNCFNGYEGNACQRQTCPGTNLNGNISCSGRGRCYSMGKLTAIDTALPLTYQDSTHLVYETLPALNYSDPHYSITQIENTNANSTSQLHQQGWDADLGQACVCDSGWPVGLHAGQTQVAEFFGPACELRHCPSGNDPLTPLVDETNCTGKAMRPGGHVGGVGNLCHVDCSNRGLCDYNTGICTCYHGFIGSACEIWVKDHGPIREG